MATIIQEEACSLVEHFKKLINNEYNDRIDESRIIYNSNELDDGQIYKLIKNDKIDGSVLVENCAAKEKQLKASDMYVNANEYVEVKKMAQACNGMVIPMHDVFGVAVLNTLWRMMAGKRLFNLYLLEIFIQKL